MSSSWKNSVPDAELYTYDYFFLDYVCRLCWCADGTVELTSFDPKSTANDATIAEKIKECIGIDVSTHTHPKKVCSKCLNEVEIFTEFKRFCQETERKLNNILENGMLIEKVETGDELLILKQESNIEFSNIDYIDNLFDDIPLSCEISGNADRQKKGRKKRPECYCNSCHLNLECIKKLTKHNFECHGIEENGLYKCFGCEKRFKSVKKRLRHESDTCKNLKPGYKCNICDRFLPKRRVYEHHMRAHRENKEINFADEYKCHKCKDTFTSIEFLREHMLTHFKKEKRSYICDTCGRVFSRRDYLNKHALTHTRSRLLKCPHCDYSALQKSTLNVHIRKHTGERPYPCDLCPQRCVTSSNLRDHRKRHFGIKAFECKLCDKKFGYKLSLEEHMATTHERSETHSCTHCGITYNRFRSLRHHLLAKHGKKIRKTRDDIVELQNCDDKHVTVDQVTIGDKQMTVDSNQVTEANKQVTIGDKQMTVDSNQVTETNKQVTIGDKQMTVDSNQVTEANKQVKIESEQNMTIVSKQLLTVGIGQFTIDSNPLTVGNEQVTADKSEVIKENKQMTVGLI